jgi:hypothetical protein
LVVREVCCTGVPGDPVGKSFSSFVEGVPCPWLVDESDSSVDVGLGGGVDWSGFPVSVATAVGDDSEGGVVGSVEAFSLVVEWCCLVECSGGNADE